MSHTSLVLKNLVYHSGIQDIDQIENVKNTVQAVIHFGKANTYLNTCFKKGEDKIHPKRFMTTPLSLHIKNPINRFSRLRDFSFNQNRLYYAETDLYQAKRVSDLILYDLRIKLGLQLLSKQTI